MAGLNSPTDLAVDVVQLVVATTAVLLVIVTNLGAIVDDTVLAVVGLAFPAMQKEKIKVN